MTETRRKTARITLRAEPWELSQIAAKAKLAMVSVPEYMRRASLGRRINHSSGLTTEALRELSRIGSNLNQIARSLNSGGHNLEMVGRAIAGVDAAVARLTGSEPST